MTELLRPASLESCPGCGALLPKSDGPTHRYLGASAACWAVFSALGAGEPPVAPLPLNALLVDAYAAQHPGLPSNQSIQSVAVHLLTLYGVLERGRSIHEAFELRVRALRDGSTHKHERFSWLEPPSFVGVVTVADVAAATTPEARAERVTQLVEGVWSRWSVAHGGVIADWFERFVVPERL